MRIFPEKACSVFLWVPCVWYAITSIGPVGRWVTSGSSAGDFSAMEGSSIDRLIFGGLILCGLLILGHRRFSWERAIFSNKWLFAILAYALVSILWSRFPEVAVKRWVKLFGSVVMAFVVLTEDDPVEAISSFFRRCFLVHIPLDIVFVKYFREYGVGWDDTGTEMWTGLTSHKNVLGQVCMTAGIYFIWDMMKDLGRKRVFIDAIYLAAILFLMNGPGYSRSVTSFVGLFMGLTIYFGLRFAPKDEASLNKYFVKGAAIVILLLVFVQAGMWAFDEGRTLGSASFEFSGRDATLTGRTDLWKDILRYASAHPVAGVGYGSFWIGSAANDLWETHFWKPQQGHNGYIDIYVELGLAGLFLFGGLLVSVFRKIKQNLVVCSELGPFQMALFLVIVVHNISESSWLRGDVDLWLAFLLVSIMIPANALETRDDAAYAMDHREWFEHPEGTDFRLSSVR